MHSDLQPKKSEDAHLPSGLVMLRSRDGAEISVSLHGGHVCSWRTADGVERLFLSALTKWDGATAIRGGIPVIFPQFANRGPLPKHGFARTSLWTLAASGMCENGDGFIHLTLRESVESRLLFPYNFKLDLHVTFSGESINTTLTVANTGAETFSFTGALHSYLVADVAQASIQGLSGLPAENSVAGSHLNFDEHGELRIESEVDCIFFEVGEPIALKVENFSITSQQVGFADVVVWNPWSEGSKTISDLNDDAYKDFVCIEAAAIEKPVILAAGHQWSGQQHLTAQTLR